MFIMTENEEIVNIDHYYRIEMYRNYGKFDLRALRPASADGTYRQLIARFDNEEEARSAIRDIGIAIQRGDKIWYVNNVPK